MVSVLAPTVARAEPIPIGVSSAIQGFTMTGASAGSAIDLGTITMPSASAVGDLILSGFRTNQDIVVSFLLEGIGSFDTLRLEVFNPGGSSNWADPAGQPGGLPQGCVLVISMTYIIANMLTDAVYKWLDPRIRVS